jgi:hypothetical protein
LLWGSRNIATGEQKLLFLPLNMAKKRKVSESRTVDTDTGEIFTETKVFVYTADYTSFCKVYTGDYQQEIMSSLIPIEYKLLMYSLGLISFDTNCVTFSKSINAKICLSQKMSLSGKSQALRLLCDKGVFRKVCNNTYFVNPLLFFRGNEGDRMSCVRSWNDGLDYSSKK